MNQIQLSARWRHAMLYPEPGKGGRGKKNGSDTEQFSKVRLSYARAVLRHLAEAVRDGRRQ